MHNICVWFVVSLNGHLSFGDSDHASDFTSLSSRSGQPTEGRSAMQSNQVIIMHLSAHAVQLKANKGWDST